ncbi:MAG: DUF4430 domain-containing protein [bacterium]|nr:DUF4430 domain-containing protein [bacterium]
MRRNIFIAGFVVFFLAGVVVGGCGTKSNESAPQTTTPAVPQATVNVVIDFGTGFNDESTVPYGSTLTVFSALEAALVGKNYPLDADRSSDLGVFVRGIGGKNNGDEKKYWQYWVNEAFPLIAADKYYLVPNDIVQWKFTEQQKMK